MSALVGVLSLLMSLTNSPLVVGVYLGALTMVCALWVSVYVSAWLGCAVLIMYMGGLMVLFLYFLAIRPNHLIEVDSSWSVWAGVMVIWDVNAEAPMFLGWSLAPSFLAVTILAGVSLFLGMVAVVSLSGARFGALRAWRV